MDNTKKYKIIAVFLYALNITSWMSETKTTYTFLYFVLLAEYQIDYREGIN